MYFEIGFVAEIKHADLLEQFDKADGIKKFDPGQTLVDEPGLHTVPNRTQDRQGEPGGAIARFKDCPQQKRDLLLALCWKSLRVQCSQKVAASQHFLKKEANLFRKI